MRGKMTEEKVVEHLLNEFPIKELQDLRQRNALIATLLNGEKRMIEFEKLIVPAEVVGSFHVVKHFLSESKYYSNEHYSFPIEMANSYQKARALFERKEEDLTKRIIDDSMGIKVMLVGEYKGQHLDFSALGIIDVNTGITLSSAMVTKNNPIEKVDIDPDESISVNNKIYVLLDRTMAQLKFENRFYPDVTINVDFWKIDRGKKLSTKQSKGGGLDDDNLLHKRKNQDMSTELWVPDLLLSKRQPGGKSNGKGV